MDCAFKLPQDFEQLVHAAIVKHLKPHLVPVVYVPDCTEIGEVLQVALWSSVLRDEGRVVRFTINLRPRTTPSRVIPFARPIGFTAAQLAKLSMATTPDVSAVHVGPGADGLEIFGIDTVFGDASAVRVEVLGPATVAIKSGSVTVAFISGNNAELISVDIYAKYFFIDVRFPAEHGADSDREHRFFDIARAMHRHGHGGTLLVLGSDTTASRVSELSSSIEPHYELAHAFDGLREVDAAEASIFGAMQTATSASEARDLFSQLRATEVLHFQYISGLARTTAVDGATVVSWEGSLLAFGCKILLQNRPLLRLRRPTAAAASLVDLADFGGTRHQSAARFVGMNPGSRAIVSSQDAKVSILNHVAIDEVDCLEHAEWCF